MQFRAREGQSFPHMSFSPYEVSTLRTKIMYYSSLYSQDVVGPQLMFIEWIKYEVRNNPLKYFASRFYNFFNCWFSIDITLLWANR